MRLSSVVVATVFITSGCAVGVKHQYHDINPETTLHIHGNIAVGVHDRRPYVVTGDKAETFVGLTRGGYGNPFDVNTESGSPLAKDFRAAIVSLLKRSGATVTEVEFKPSASGVDVRQFLTQTGADKSVLLTLREWKSDTYMSTALHYDIELIVFGSKNDVLGNKTLVGKDDLGGSLVNPPAHARSAVPAAFRKKLEELFSDPNIVQALQ